VTGSWELITPWGIVCVHDCDNERVLAVLSRLAIVTSYSDIVGCQAGQLISSVMNFTITAEIHPRSLATFYGQYADRHINLKFVSAREREIRQSVIVKNKLMSVFNASVLLLTMNFVITLSK